MPASASAPPRPVGLDPLPLAAVADLVGARMPDGSGASVSGVSLRNTAVQRGDVFVAVRGSTAHGAQYATDAVRRGATAIVTDGDGAAIVRDQHEVDRTPLLVVDHPRSVVGRLASRVYGDPSRHLTVLGVTGTAGKTTTCYLLEAGLTAAGRRAGLIGTVEARIDGEVLPSMLTTPEATDLQALFAVMRQRGVDAVAMEVSSHALALGRVAGTEFAVGGFTNLSQDHLDFHGDMESYFAAKSLIFDGRARAEVVVVDDEYGRRLAADRTAAVTVSGRPDAQADWTAGATDGGEGRQRLSVVGPGNTHITADLALPGAFNVTNAVTALAMLSAAGIDPAVAAAGLRDVAVPGRMQRVEAGQPYLALVDYAHKPAALSAVLTAARSSCTGRLILVIGAGGDRDRGKRSMMGEVAASMADLVIVTDDNPRSEAPAAIRRQILAGTRGPDAVASVREIGDRRDAIRAAVAAAGAGDVVLVAGKGHEQGQETGGVVHPFSDRQELLAAITGRPGSGT